MRTIRPLMIKLWSLSLAIFLVAGALDAANLHTIIICDTYAENIGDSVEADLNRVRAEIHRAAFYTKLNVREKIFIDYQVDENVLQWLKNYEVSKDDVVFIFFSGHGYRTDSKTDNTWPNLYFTPVNRGVDFHQLTQIIQNKSPKLMIAIADCCNNVLSEAYAPHLMKAHPLALSYHKPNVKNNYEKLFLHSYGSLIASSSTPGEYSWGTKSGGLFTLALFDSLDHEVNSFNPSWDVLLTRAQKTVLDREVGQTPQYESSVKPK
ncbi:MAG: caspase family protein [Chlamydiota bacterium]